MATIITTDIERAAKRLDKTIVLQPGSVLSEPARQLAGKLDVRIVEATETARPQPLSVAPAVPAPAEPSAPARPRSALDYVPAQTPFAPPRHQAIADVGIPNDSPTLSGLNVRPVSAIPQAPIEPVLAGLPEVGAATHAAPAATHARARRGASRTSTVTAMPVGVVLGRVVRSEDVVSAANHGLKLLRAAASAYITRAAQHAAEVHGIVIFTDPNFASNGGEDGFGVVLNPLESGGANTRVGPGIVRSDGIPIGGDHVSGTLL